MSFVLRTFRDADRSACAVIFARAWSQAFPHLPRTPNAEAFDFETADETIRVAVGDGAVLGFAAVYAPGSFLHHLYVEPEAQRKGIGEALLRDAIKRAQSKLSLKCQIDNARALTFYKKRGFIARDHGVDETGAWVRLYGPPTLPFPSPPRAGEGGA